MLHVIVTSLFGTALKRLVEYMGWRIGVSMRALYPPFVSRLCICALENPSRAHAMLSMGYSMNGGYVSANARESRQQGGCTTMQRAKQISESIELGIILALAGGFMDVYSYIGRDHVFANAQTGVGRVATQRATTPKPESASSKTCWVRRRRNARRSSVPQWRLPEESTSAALMSTR